MSYKCESCKWFKKYNNHLSVCILLDGRINGGSKKARTCEKFRQLKMKPNKRKIMKSIIRNRSQIQALLNGATQIRVPIKKDWIQSTKEPLKTNDGIWHFWYSGEYAAPFQIGDEVFVKEKFVIGLEDGHGAESEENPLKTFYAADDLIHDWIDQDDEDCNVPWKPSIHMNKEISRFTLRITNVRVERLQKITVEDMEREGLDNMFIHGDREELLYEQKIDLWDAYAKDSFKWKDNPYVFVYDFEIVKGK